MTPELLTEKDKIEHALHGDRTGSGSMVSLIYDREVLVRALLAGRTEFALTLDEAHALALGPEMAVVATEKAP